MATLAFSCVVLLTLLIDGSALVRGVRVVGRVPHLAVALIDHATTGATVLTRHLAVGGLITDGRKLRTDTTAVGGRLTSLGWVGGTRGLDLVGLCRLGSSALTFLNGLALRLFLLLAGLPFLANLFEF